MGQSGTRSVDSSSPGHGGKNLSSSCQSGKGVGKRHLAECRVVRSEGMLRESGLGAYCAALEQIQSLPAHASVQTTERYLGCKQNLGHPVNDLFELRTGGPQENDDTSATVKASSDPVEKASGRGVECRHGGPEHDQPVCDSRQLSLPERTDLVEVRKGNRPHSLRRCPGARASRGDSGSKEDGQPDPAVVGSVGLGTDRKSTRLNSSH